MSRLAGHMLLEARERVREGWCQGASALDERGRPVNPWLDDACRWSVAGALVHAWAIQLAAEGPKAARSFERANLALLAAIGGVPPKTWNDTPGRTKEAAVAALSRAFDRTRTKRTSGRRTRNTTIVGVAQQRVEKSAARPRSMPAAAD
jgi:hypothetical protein